MNGREREVTCEECGYCWTVSLSEPDELYTDGDTDLISFPVEETEERCPVCGSTGIF